MRVVSAYLLGLLAAALGRTVAVMIPAYVTGRVEIFYKPRTFFIWGVRENSGRGGLPWILIAALARALGAFGAARIVFAAFAVPPAPLFAAGLLLMLVWWDVRRAQFVRRVPIAVPPEVQSLNTVSATVNGLAAAAMAVVFLYV